MDEKIQTAVYFTNGNKEQQGTINFQELETYLNTFPEVAQIRHLPEISTSNLKKVTAQIKKGGLNRIVIAGDMPGIAKDFISRALELSGKDSNQIILADFKEYGTSINGETERAKAILACTLHDVPFQTAAEPKETNVNPETLVIGGGIAGIQAALEIANSNNKVYLVERESTIGGHMAMFDKTFPTLDCAACILTPKMVDVGQHEKIKLLTHSEVEGLKGQPGKYKVKIRKKTRYVNKNCTGCGECEVACPVSNIPQVKSIPFDSRNIENIDLEKLERIVSKYSHDITIIPAKHMLIQIMQDINHEYNYLPEYSLKYLSSLLDIPLPQIYHVATFYSSFSLTPRGEHLIKICMGTACHTRGAARILDEFERQLQISCGETTPDLKFTLDTVNCLGCCALAPVITVDEDYHTLSVRKVGSLLKNYK